MPPYRESPGLAQEPIWPEPKQRWGEGKGGRVERSNPLRGVVTLQPCLCDFRVSFSNCNRIPWTPAPASSDFAPPTSSAPRPPLVRNSANVGGRERPKSRGVASPDPETGVRERWPSARRSLCVPNAGRAVPDPLSPVPGSRSCAVLPEPRWHVSPRGVQLRLILLVVRGALRYHPPELPGVVHVHRVAQLVNEYVLH